MIKNGLIVLFVILWQYTSYLNWKYEKLAKDQQAIISKWEEKYNWTLNNCLTLERIIQKNSISIPEKPYDLTK